MGIYTPRHWVNDTEPAIDEDNLNHLERGTEYAHNDIEDIAVGTVSARSAMTASRAQYIPVASDTIIGGIHAYTVTDSSSGEVTGYLNSTSLTTRPGNITDLQASDNLPGTIKLDYTPASSALWHDVLRDNVLIATNIQPGHLLSSEAGTWNFRIIPYNTVGEGLCIPDSGTAVAIPTEPPVYIDDFTASDSYSLQVIFDWTDNGDSFRFDVYLENTIIIADCRPGVTYARTEGTDIYHVRATNLLGGVDSNDNDGTALGMTPDAITDYSASDDRTVEIQSQFTNVRQPATYDLYKDNVLVMEGINNGHLLQTFGGTFDFKVIAHNTVAATDSNIDSGTALDALYPPDGILDFVASDTERREVVISFSPAIDASAYDLYRSDILVASNVYSGYRFDTESGTWPFYVKARNIKGETNSNVDDGTAIAALTGPPSAIIDFVASDTYTNAIRVTFSKADEATRYDLYRDGIPLHTDIKSGDVFNTLSGTWDFYVTAYNILGSTNSNIDSGTAIASTTVPEEITDLTASDDQVASVIIEFTSPSGSARNDLYRNGSLIQSDIQSPYVHTTPEGTWNFGVRANNLHGHTDSNTDSGTAIEPKEAPIKITDFEASDGLVGVVLMTFSNAYGAESYDLYRDNAFLVGGIHNGYILPSDEVNSWEFYVVAKNTFGSTPSNENTGSSVEVPKVPEPIVDMTASDGYEGYVIIDCTVTADTTTFDLEEDAAIVETDIDLSSGQYTRTVSPGTRAYRVLSNNLAGTTPSNPDMGTSVAEDPLPEYVNNFAASENSETEVTFTWTPGNYTDYYSIYDYDQAEYVLTFTTPGSSFVPDDTAIHSYRLVAYNSEGSTQCNSNNGQMLPEVIIPGSVTIYRDGYTFTGNGDGTVSISNGVGTFTPPTEGTLIADMSAVGGGGGGAASQQDNFFNTGGGHGSPPVCVSSEAIDAPINLTVGLGGAGGFVDGEGTVDGSDGGNSTVGGLTSFGGLGGTGSAYNGNGNSKSTCLGSSFDGTASPERAFGGEGSLGDGGEGRSSKSSLIGEEGGKGAGGGGVNANEDNSSATHTGGKGGDGQLTISWAAQ